MIRKPFEQSEYDEFDKKAKNLVMKYLQEHGFKLDIPREDFEADIMAYRPERHEVEIKRNWIGPWPEQWKDVHIPERKGRLLKSGRRLYFWILSGDLKSAWVVASTHLQPALLKEISNSKVAEGERFYCVPLSLCHAIKIGG